MVRMMRAASILGGVLVIGGCARSAAVSEPTVPDAVHDQRFVIVDGMTARLAHLTARGVAIDATVQLPAPVDVVVWSGADPVVWMTRRSNWFMGGDPDAAPPGPPNQMGTITASGFHALTPLAWPATPRPTNEQFADMASPADFVELIAGADGTTWQGHCSWYGGPDGGGCITMTYARRIPAPVVFATEPPARAPGWAPPAIAPSATTIVKLERPDSLPDGASPDDGSGGQEYYGPKFLHCTEPGRARVEYPRRGDDGAGDGLQSQPEWISTTPPIYQVDTAFWAGVGPAPEPSYVVFEGCAPSQRYARAFAGPHGLIILAGRELAVLAHGQLVARAAIPGDHIAFAPSPGAL
jgi:hypothetical protein